VAFSRFSSVAHVPFPLWSFAQEGDYVSVTRVRTFPLMGMPSGSCLGFGGAVFPRHFAAVSCVFRACVSARRFAAVSVYATSGCVDFRLAHATSGCVDFRLAGSHFGYVLAAP